MSSTKPSVPHSAKLKDRKYIFKERKHERHVYPTRFKDSSSHYGSRDGGSQLHREASGRSHGCMPLNDQTMEENSLHSSHSLLNNWRKHSIDWEPHGWTRPRSLSSRSSGLRSKDGSNASKDSKKKRRLNWGDGLVEFEKNKAIKLGSSLNITLDKTPKISTVAPSLGANDKLFVKTATVDNDTSNLGGSLYFDSQNNLLGFSLDSEKVGTMDSMTRLDSSLVELVNCDDPSSADYSMVRSAEMNKLLIWKANISKVLEVTETEIDLLENELKSLNSEYGDRFLCSTTVGSLPVCYSAKSFDQHVRSSDKVVHLEPLQNVSCDDGNVEKMSLSTNLHGMFDDGKEDGIDSLGTTTSKFVELLPFIKAVSSRDTRRYGTCSENLDGIQSTAMKCSVPYTYGQVANVSAGGDGNFSVEIEDGKNANSSASIYSSTGDVLYNSIISSNKESAKRASEVFTKLLPTKCAKISNIGVSSSSLSHNGAFIVENFVEKKRFARFKEKVMTIKFKAFHHLWKEDMRLLSIAKSRSKSHRKLELSVRAINSDNQKNRSSIRSSFPFPAGNDLSLVATSEMINYTSQLLSKSQYKLCRSTLKMPALILDQEDKMFSMFKSSNGLVEDPLAVEKERAMINPWTSEEREIFLEKFEAFGKDFRKIASFLDYKTIADCVEFYYKNQKSDCFEKIKKKGRGKLGKNKTDSMASDKKGNYEENTPSPEILSAASVMARLRSGSFLLRGYDNIKTSTGDDRIPEISSNLDILRDERVAVAVDALNSLCGSLISKAMSSSITSSVDPVEANWNRNVDGETGSVEGFIEMDPSDWTDEEMAVFIQAVSYIGKDFATIAQFVRTRSPDQCKLFFTKARKFLGSDLLHPIPDYIGSLEKDDANGGKNDKDNACCVETDEDLHSAVMITYHNESNPVEARNLSADLLPNGGNQLHNPGNLLDHVEAANFLQCCTSSATEMPFLSQTIEQTDYQTQLRSLSDSEKTSRKGKIKLFGKILTNPSSTQKSNVTAKGKEENDTHHLKFTGHQNAGEHSDHRNYYGFEDVITVCHWDGNITQSDFLSLNDSDILLANYPAEFSSNPLSSAILEQQPLTAMAQNNKQDLNEASAFTSKEVGGSNHVVDYPMLRNKDSVIVQPFMVDGKHCQDMFSEMQKGNDFEAASSSQQQQSRGMWD